MATNFEPTECVIFGQSTKIGTQENKAIYSNVKALNSHIFFLFFFPPPTQFWKKLSP